jgi:hypothetical protein
MMTGIVNGERVAIDYDLPSNNEMGTGIETVMNAVETFRVAETGYPARIDDIDAADLVERLGRFSLINDWSSIPNDADDRHREYWEETSRSLAMRAFADAGYSLYNTFFTKGSKARAAVDALEPGDPLEIFWSQKADATPHVPWGLMFNQPVGDIVDPAAFIGLRFRITYTTHGGTNGETTLGTFAKSRAGVTLYWGESEIGAEANWQREIWETPQAIARVFKPAASSQDPKNELTKWLQCPDPQPMPILYFYCRTAKDGNDQVLMFGEQGDSKVRLLDLGTDELPDAPLVFANACTTSSSDPERVNVFEKRFFDRHCRAYIGTECRVGAPLASRFAYIFHALFERSEAGRTITAGEAVSQARLFLWSHYRNLGGLFYALINQSELYLIDDTADVSA